MKYTKGKEAALRNPEENNLPEELSQESLIQELAAGEAASWDTSDKAADKTVSEEAEIENTDKKDINKKKARKEKKEKKKKKVKDKTKPGKLKPAMAKLKDMLTYVGEQTLPFRRQIRFKLVAAFFVPAILIVALGLFSVIQSQGTIVESYESSSAGNIENSALYCSLLMKDIETKASQMAGYVDFYAYYVGFETNSKSASNSLFTSATTNMNTLVSSSVGIYGAYAFGRVGNAMSSLAASPSKTIYADFEASEEGARWKEAAKTVGGATSAWVGYHRAVDDGVESKPELYAASYIRNFYKGDGYIVFDLLTSKVKEVLENSVASDNSIVAFVTPDGRETISTGKSESAELAEGETIFFGSRFYEKAVKGEVLNGKDYVSYKGKTNLFVYSKVGNTGAIICTLIPRSDIFGRLNSIRIATTLFVLISFAIAIFIGLLLSTDIGKAINRFSVAFKHISAGDFTLRINTRRKDEFGVLAHDMDDMLDKIRDLVADMTNFGHNVSDAAYKVSGASGEILTSINEVSETVNVMGQGVQEQAKDTEKSFLQMTEFAGQIGEACKDTEIVGRVANNTQQIISGGKDIVNELIQQVTSTSEVTGIIIKDIEELERQSKSIGSVVGTINGIASTTNLLSLNASIEAARAGDAGRGFAVVAEEIRRLAEQSVTAVKSIEKIIKSIQQKTLTTAESAARTEQMLNLQTEALNNTVKVFQEVDSHMIDLLEKINRITDNMRTVTVSKDEVLDAIKNIAAVTQQTLASSEVVDTNINNQIISIETLNSQAEDMKERARQLEEAIAKFII
jgi:methyl-accepting chemotaxis protein